MSIHDVTGPMDNARTGTLLRALAVLDGAGGRVIAFTESHAMLVLRFTQEANPPTTILCGACTRIETPARWQVRHLEYSVTSTAPHLYRLTDSAAGFAVDCGVIRVAVTPDEWRQAESVA